MAENKDKNNQVQIEFKCVHCGANNIGYFDLGIDENIRDLIKRTNALTQKTHEKYPEKSNLDIWALMSEDRCKYVICQVCQVPNYPFVK